MKRIKLPSWISRLLGADPIAAPPHVFALDRQSVRYARLAGQSDRLDFLEYHERPLPDDVFADGPLGGTVREVEVLRSVLSEVVDRVSVTLGEASLVVPDEWLRASFVELDELPAQRDARREVVLWKLKRLVPFRVEELRVTELEVEQLPGQNVSHRLLVGFGSELLLSQIEDLFQDRSIRIGRITNDSLSVLGALPDPGDDERVRAMTIVTPAGYTILFSRRERPLLYRYKEVVGEVGERRALRDLRLSRMFLAEQMDDAPLEAVGLLAPAADVHIWRQWLESTFDSPVVDLSAYEFGLSELPAEVDWVRLAPLVGAVRQEVA